MQMGRIRLDYHQVCCEGFRMEFGGWMQGCAIVSQEGHAFIPVSVYMIFSQNRSPHARIWHLIDSAVLYGETWADCVGNLLFHMGISWELSRGRDVMERDMYEFQRGRSIGVCQVSE